MVPFRDLAVGAVLHDQVQLAAFLVVEHFQHAAHVFVAQSLGDFSFLEDIFDNGDVLNCLRRELQEPSASLTCLVFFFSRYSENFLIATSSLVSVF